MKYMALQSDETTIKRSAYVHGISNDVHVYMDGVFKAYCCLGNAVATATARRHRRRHCRRVT